MIRLLSERDKFACPREGLRFCYGSSTQREAVQFSCISKGSRLDFSILRMKACPYSRILTRILAGRDGIQENVLFPSEEHREGPFPSFKNVEEKLLKQNGR